MMYEIWFASDNSESSMFPPAMIDDNARQILTYNMERVLRFWAPSLKAASFILRLYEYWRFSRFRVWWYR